MSIIILKELEPYTINSLDSENSDLILKFGLQDDPDKFNKIINELNSTTYLKHRKPKQNLSDISTVYTDISDEEEGIPLALENVETYQFTFVGIIIILDFILIIYPKHVSDIYEDQNNHYKKFKQILKVIHQYNHRLEQKLILTTGELSKNKSQLSLAIQLLEYYSENGLYSVEQDLVEENGGGQIIWEKTINEIPVILSGYSPVYLTPFTELTITDDFHIIRLIQLAILNEIKKEFHDILFLLGYEIPEESSLLLKDLEDTDTLLYYLEKEFQTQFVSHKIELIKLLAMYLSNETREYKNDTITIFGVSRFNLVWEDACKKIYGDNLEDTLADLKLEPIGTLSSKSKLKDVISKPLWTDLSTKRTYHANKSLELDVLNIDSSDKTDLKFHIYDGKYYSITFENNIIKGQPGVGDITKQYLYEQSYKELANKNNYTFTNQFIIPKDNLAEDKGTGVLFADVSLPLFSDFKLENIKVIARDCEVFFNQYLES